MGRASRAILLLCLLAFLAYSNTFSVPFQFDDADNIVENPKVHHLPRALDFSGTRSVGFLSFALNYHFGGLNVFGYHLVNLVIHIINGFLVYSLVLLLFRASAFGQARGPAPTDDGRNELRPYVPFIALAAALLFVAHPIQTQAVTYIVQRFASLVALFYLATVVGYLKWRLGGRWLWYAASLLSCLLAMKTKENSFTLPIMILLVEVVFLQSNNEKRWLSLIPFLLTLLITPFSHVEALGEAEGFARDTAEINRSDYLFTQFRVIVTYLRLLVLPINQNLDYDYPIYRSLFHPAVFLSFLFLLSLLGFAFYGLFRPRSSTNNPQRRLIAFGILWFFLTLFIESSIIPIRDVIFEHRLYLPSAGFFLVTCLLAARGWERWEKIRFPLAVSFFIIISGLAVTTYRRNLVWGSAVTLWQDVVSKAPGKGRAHSNLGSTLAAQGRTDEAIREYQTAVKLQPDYPQAHNNLGSAFMVKGRIDEAIREYQAALKVAPDMAEVHYNLGLALAKQGRTDEAIREYQNALQLRPDYAKAHTNLGAIYATEGHLEEATREFEVVMKLKPDSAEAHNNLGNVYLLQGHVEEAVKQYREALRLKPDFTEARNNLDKATHAHPFSQ